MTGDPGGGRSPVTQGGHALIWLWFYGRHKPDGPQLLLLGHTASLTEDHFCICVSLKVKLFCCFLVSRFTKVLLHVASLFRSLAAGSPFLSALVSLLV